MFEELDLGAHLASNEVEVKVMLHVRTSHLVVLVAVEQTVVRGCCPLSVIESRCDDTIHGSNLGQASYLVDSVPLHMAIAYRMRAVVSFLDANFHRWVVDFLSQLIDRRSRAEQRLRTLSAMLCI